MDAITIKNLQLFAYHGVNQEEKDNGQFFNIDIKYYLNITQACHSDNIDDTVSYAKVTKAVKKAFTQEKYDLIEKAAQVVTDAVLDNFSDIVKVDVKVKKPQAPVFAKFDYMAVEISRER